MSEGAAGEEQEWCGAHQPALALRQQLRLPPAVGSQSGLRGDWRPPRKAAVGGAPATLRPERRHRPIAFRQVAVLLGSPGSWLALIG